MLNRVPILVQMILFFPNKNFFPCKTISMHYIYHCTIKWSFPLRIFSLNVTKSAGNCDIYILKIFTFLSLFFDYVENGLIRKLRSISKFMTLQVVQQIIAIHILPKSLKKWRQSDIEIWSFNRISGEKYFSLNTIRKMRQGE